MIVGPKVRTFVLWFSLGIAFDIFIALGVYAALPNPTLLLKGVTLERWTKNKKPIQFTAGPKNKKYVPLHNIPKALQHALLFLEDNRFYIHRGFDMAEIVNALQSSFKSGRRLRGASSLSQQLVKNLYLSPERTFRRKLLEALITIKLELSLPKTKILELYLNSIDWGRGLFGIADASYYYFQKPPHQLDARECVFLAAIVPNPSRFSQLDEDLVPKRFVRVQMMRAFEALYQARLITLAQYQDVLLRPFGNKDEPEITEEDLFE